MKLYTLLFALLFSGAMLINAQQNCKVIQSENLKSQCIDRTIGKSIATNLDFPDDVVLEFDSKMLYVRFTTDENGKVENARVLGVSEKELSEAVIEAIYKMSLDVDNSILATNEVYRIPILIETED